MVTSASQREDALQSISLADAIGMMLATINVKPAYARAMAIRSLCPLSISSMTCTPWLSRRLSVLSQIW
jgi:hypothetical protein